MEKRYLIPNTDLSIYPIGFGTVDAGGLWSDEHAHMLMDAYVENGGNLIDTARVYTQGKSEGVVGDWMAKRGNRKELVVITKGGHPPMSDLTQSRMKKADMQSDLETSLRELKTDYIDMYFYHRDDLSQPVGDLIEVMEDFVKQGKIRYYGCSNWTTERMKQADEYAKAHSCRSFMANQMLYNIAAKDMKPFPDKTMVAMDSAMLAYHKQNPANLVMPYFGVCSGFFHIAAEKGLAAVENSPYYTPANLELVKKVEALRKKYNASISQIVLGFFFQQDFMAVPLYGSKDREQLLDAMGTLDIKFNKKDFE